MQCCCFPAQTDSFSIVAYGTIGTKGFNVAVNGTLHRKIAEARLSPSDGSISCLLFQCIKLISIHELLTYFVGW